MIETTSTLELGSAAPPFDGLLGTDGLRYSLSSFDGSSVLVVVFFANACPTAKGYEDRLRRIADDYADRGVRLVAINSNNPHLSPRESYPEMVSRAQASEFNFSYVKDEDRSVAAAFGAVCTPHVFVFDRARRLRYRGRIDDSRLPENVTRSDLRNSLDALLEERPVPVAETEPFGCGIVW